MKRIGLTLIEMAIVLVIVGLLLGLGTGFMIKFIKWKKHKELEDLVSQNANSLIDNAISNGSLPNNFTGSQKLIYVVSRKLTASYLKLNHATICDIKDSELKYQDNNTNITMNNIAFVLFSKGEDYTSDTYCNGIKVDSNQTCMGNLTTDSSKDVINVITLPELKEILGCQGIPLKILNSELPIGIAGESYSVEIVASGGIKPYKWCYTGTLPSGISANPNAVCPHYQQADHLLLSGTPTSSSSQKIKICVEDSNTPSPYNVCKFFVITINPQITGNGTSGGNSNCPSGYSIHFNAVNLGREWIWLWSLWYTYDNGKYDKEFIDLIPDGSTSHYNSPSNLHIFPSDLIRVAFMWRSSKYFPILGTASNLDKNSDCSVFIKCTIPPQYDGTNVDVVQCTSE